MQLYDYHRSTAAYRVRIVLALKGLSAERIAVPLLDNVQKSADYTQRNPQGLVPTLVTDDGILTQSLAICEYLDECYPEPRLLPSSAFARAQIRAMAQLIACDIHPLNNLRVMRHLAEQFDANDAAKHAWMHHWMHEGFAALERMLQRTSGAFCYGYQVSLADVALVPQMYNAQRFGCDTSAYPLISAITERCLSLDAFSTTAPEKQK
ncbi:MAG: maleylacetoacetate isomerase [Formosimonas sp.]